MLLILKIQQKEFVALVVLILLIFIVMKTLVLNIQIEVHIQIIHNVVLMEKTVHIMILVKLVRLIQPHQIQLILSQILHILTLMMVIVHIQKKLHMEHILIQVVIQHIRLIR